MEEGRYKGYVEAHIEQGTVLESAGEQVGVVTGIVAIWQYRITVRASRTMPAAPRWRSAGMPD